MSQIKLPLQCGEAIVLQGNYDGSAADFSALARLTHTGLLANTEQVPHSVCENPDWQVPVHLHKLFNSGTVDVFYDSERKQCRMQIKTPDRLCRHKLGVFLWQISVIGASMCAILRGSKSHLMHCAMLEKDQRALLLCGESGIGKSTSVRRYREAGGQAVADDMVLLEYTSNDNIYVHRLPTWSSCRENAESLELLSYPFNPPLRLDGVLAISRGQECESIKPVSQAEFFAQIYRCMFFHYLNICGNLPDWEKKQLAQVLRTSCTELTKRYVPRAFFAHLQGNITETLKEIL